MIRMRDSGLGLAPGMTDVLRNGQYVRQGSIKRRTAGGHVSYLTDVGWVTRHDYRMRQAGLAGMGLDPFAGGQAIVEPAADRPVDFWTQFLTVGSATYLDLARMRASGGVMTAPTKPVPAQVPVTPRGGFLTNPDGSVKWGTVGLIGAGAVGVFYLVKRMR